MSTVSRRPSVVNKRKSVLSELGLKPSTEALSKPTTKSTIPNTSPNLTRKASIANKSVSPSASKAATTTTRRSVVPSTIKVDRTTSNNSLKSPTSPNPKQRSFPPTQKTSISPHGQRGSATAGNSNSSSSANKRMSTPSGLNSLIEVDIIKNQLVDKDNEIQKLKEIETEREHKISALEIELEKLKAELKLSLEAKVDNEEKERMIKQEAKLETETLLKEQEIKHNLERDTLLKDHETRLQEQKKESIKEYETRLQEQRKNWLKEQEIIQTNASSDTEEKINALKYQYDSEIEQLKREQDVSKKTQNEELAKTLLEFQKQKDEQQLTVSNLKEQLQALEDSQSIGYLRKVQNELETTLAAFEEYKRASQHEVEVLEKRYREEIKQLQNGNDDTAEAWLEKTRSAQQEANKLHDEIRLKDQEYKQAIQMLKDIHSEEEEKLHEICDEKEAQIEAQSHQIENLLYQVETLQNTLEAATVRLEHTAKSTPATSNSNDDTNSAAKIAPPKDIHQEFTSKMEAKQKEIDDLRANISELKETHEIQMNRLAQEKANKIQVLNKKVSTLEEELATATPPLSPTTDSSHDQQLLEVAEKHRIELKNLYEQYQLEVDDKSRELEDYVYRVKAIMAARQKDTEKMRMEADNIVDKYEKDIKDYEAKLIEYEKELTQLKDENSQLVRLVNQLQSEIHT